MKVALVFLTVFVAFSNQQFRQRMLRPWLLPIQSPTDNQLILLDNRYLNQIDTLQREQGLEIYQSRNKGFSYPDQQNARFFFNYGSSTFANPLLKTSTTTITSTCTNLTIVTCIRRAQLLPAGPAQVVACRRKRMIEVDDLPDDESDSQFPVVPSQVRSVEPTTIQQLEPVESRDPRRTTFDVFSSKEEQFINEPSSEDFAVEQPMRKGRFFYLWKSFTVLITSTTFSTTSSTLLYTLVPLDNVGVLAILPCLPAGYRIC